MHDIINDCNVIIMQLELCIKMRDFQNALELVDVIYALFRLHYHVIESIEFLAKNNALQCTLFRKVGYMGSP